MSPDDLYNRIKELIDNKETHPKVITFAELRHSVDGDTQELRRSFTELRNSGRIRVRRGMNDGLIEVCCNQM